MIVIIPKEIYSRYLWRWDYDLVVVEDTKYYIVFSARPFGLPVRPRKRSKHTVSIAEADMKKIRVIDGRISFDKYRRVFRFIPKPTKRIHIAVDESTYTVLRSLTEKSRIPLSYYLKLYINRIVSNHGLEDAVMRYVIAHVGKETYIG